MSNLLDTILNLTVFAFVGVLIWVYLARYPGRDDDSDGPAASP
jgi:hypothetical protein